MSSRSEQLAAQDREFNIKIARIDAKIAVIRERQRAARIAEGLPADPPHVPTDELLAEAAVLRAQNDLAEAEAILDATRRGAA